MKKTIWILILFVLVVGLAIYFKFPAPNISGPAIPTDWKTFTDTRQSVAFQYPDQLIISLANPSPTQYLHTVDWPPKIQTSSGPFTCTTAGSEIMPNGKTSQQTINNHTYCVTKESEGAAGSIYTQYAYAFSKDGKTVILTLTVQAVQCGNYNDPDKSVCENERASFDLDSTVDLMASSVKFK